MTDRVRRKPAYSLARRRVLNIIAAGAFVTPSLLRAESADETLSAPQEEVILTITGAITRTNAPGAALFDHAMLAALPQTTFTTATQWTPQPRQYTGPALLRVLASVGARGDRIIARAANDYQITFNHAELEDDAPIIARLLDGRQFGLRERGPLWILYPFDDEIRYRNELAYSRSVWQLTALTVED